jgi:uncharacterized RDD family membrane protein YckC
MKCPKCSYISFDSPDRCRHCGYDFSLATPEPVVPDLPLRDESREPMGLPDDLPLSEGGGAARVGAGRSRAGAARSAFELPLFEDGGEAAEPPVVPAPRAPRPPLSVRRASSELARGRGAAAPAAAGSPPPDARLEFVEAAEPDVGPGPVERPSPPPPQSARAAAGPPPAPAPLGRRVAAGVVDLLLLGAIDAAVLHFTLQITGVDAANLDRLPLAPLLAFLALLSGGYLVVFTLASGQTIGQMLTSVRVVGSEGGHVTLGTSLARAGALVLSWAVAGLGFVPMFTSPDRRALHDRLAGTTVVRS